MWRWADRETLAACAEARSKGVTVFTIAFGRSISPAGKNIMRQCAGDDSRYFEAKDGADLGLVFKSIGDSMYTFKLSS